MANFYAKYSGGPFGGGGGSSANPIQEAPSGTVDGANVTFLLSQTPASSANLNLSIDGVTQRQGIEYTISGKTITMAVAPSNVPIAQTLWAIYAY